MSVLTKMDGLARVVVSSVGLIASTILSLDLWERLEVISRQRKVVELSKLAQSSINHCSIHRAV